MNHYSKFYRVQLCILNQLEAMSCSGLKGLSRARWKWQPCKCSNEYYMYVCQRVMIIHRSILIYYPSSYWLASPSHLYNIYSTSKRISRCLFSNAFCNTFRVTLFSFLYCTNFCNANLFNMRGVSLARK